MLETINTVLILRLFSQFRVSPGNAVISNKERQKMPLFIYMYDHASPPRDTRGKEGFSPGENEGERGE